jgi:hypothetical protein
MTINAAARQKIEHLLTPAPSLPSVIAHKISAYNLAANDRTHFNEAVHATPELIARIKSALSSWNPDDYEDWIRTANALQDLGEIGYDIWNNWAQQSSKYNEEEARKKWQQCPGERTGIGAIFAEAKRRGWVDPFQPDNNTAAVLPIIKAPKKPLPDAMPSVQPFDISWLPKSLQGFVEDSAIRMSCQPDFLAVASICCLAGIVGRKRFVAPKAHDDWSVYPNLWGAIIGRPSSMKSPAISAALRPIISLESQWQSEHAVAEREQRVREAFIAANTKDRKKRLASAAKMGDLEAGKEILAEEEIEALPPPKRSIINDATIEKMGELMNENPNGLLLVRDELSGLIGTLSREDAISDRAFLLECYDGKNPFTFDRIGRGTVRINSPLLSIVGGIQPSRLAGLVRETNNGTGDDGLLQRFQLMVWPDDDKSWTYVDTAPDVMAYLRYVELINKLANIPEHDPDCDDPPKPWRFSEAAQQLFIDWYTQTMMDAKSGEHSSAFESHLIKSPKTCASIALIFELADGDTDSGIIGEDATQRAINMMGYLRSHAARVYGYGNGSIIGTAHTILHYADRIQQPFTMRDLSRKGWTGVTAETIQGALDLLIDYGHVTAIATSPSVTGGRPTTYFNFV